MLMYPAWGIGGGGRGSATYDIPVGDMRKLFSTLQFIQKGPWFTPDLPRKYNKGF